MEMIFNKECPENGRLVDQCKKRLKILLSRKETFWTPEEEKILFKSQFALGMNFNKIAELLPNKTKFEVENHFYCKLKSFISLLLKQLKSQKFFSLKKINANYYTIEKIFQIIIKIKPNLFLLEPEFLMRIIENDNKQRKQEESEEEKDKEDKEDKVSIESNQKVKIEESVHIEINTDDNQTSQMIDESIIDNKEDNQSEINQKKNNALILKKKFEKTNRNFDIKSSEPKEISIEEERSKADSIKNKNCNRNIFLSPNRESNTQQVKSISYIEDSDSELIDINTSDNNKVKKEDFSFDRDKNTSLIQRNIQSLKILNYKTENNLTIPKTQTNIASYYYNSATFKKDIFSDDFMRPENKKFSGEDYNNLDKSPKSQKNTYNNGCYINPDLNKLPVRNLNINNSVIITQYQPGTPLFISKTQKKQGNIIQNFTQISKYNNFHSENIFSEFEEKEMK